jgi:hypothetical protein
VCLVAWLNPSLAKIGARLDLAWFYPANVDLFGWVALVGPVYFRSCLVGCMSSWGY